MIELTPVRQLDVVSRNGRRGYVSAASGLVRAGSFFHVVADDDLRLASFRIGADAPGRLNRLLPGRLPASPVPRKRRKPDFESLALLPPTTDAPHGRLLLLGSGSRPNRKRGTLVALGPDGEAGATRILDLTPLFAPLEGEFAELNIEGVVAGDGVLLLFQRGPDNPIVRYPLDDALKALATGQPPNAAPFIQQIDLGRLDGVPLSFTDATALPGGGIVFSAVAEDTPNAYDDGPLAGVAVGLIDPDGAVRRLERLSPSLKVEGIDAVRDGARLRLAMVTDADDPQIPASLYEAIVDGW